MGIVSGGEASSCGQEIGPVPDDEAGKGDPNGGTVGEIFPPGACAGVMILDGCATKPDLIFELTGGQDILSGDPVVTVDTPGLPDPDLAA
jgi:hypothetical protein